MELKGKLHGEALIDIFKYAVDEKFTGSIYLDSGIGDKTFYVNPQMLTFLARGEGKSPLIGQILQKMNKVTPGFIESALNDQASSNELIGEILVRFGVVSNEDVDRALRFKLEMEMFTLFQWTSGDYEIEAGPLPEHLKTKAKVTAFPLDTNAFLMETLEATHRWHDILRTVDPASTPLRISTNDLASLDNMGLSKKSIEEARYIDGSRTLNDIAEISKIGRYDFIEMIHRLVTSNLASGDGPAAEPETTPSPSYTETPQEKKKDKDEPLLSVNIDDGSTSGLLDEARRLAGMGETSSASVLFKKAIRSAVHDNDPSTASACYLEYLEVDPSDHETLKEFLKFGSENADGGLNEAEVDRLVRALSTCMDAENGEKSFQTLMAIFPNNLDYHLEYAKFLDKTGNYKKALSEYEHVRATADATERPELAQIAQELMKKVHKPAEPVSESMPPDDDTEEMTIPDELRKRKKKSNKKDPKLIIGLVLILMAAGGYFGYTNFMAKKGGPEVDPAVLEQQRLARLEADRKRKEAEEARKREEHKKRLALLERAENLENEGNLSEAVSVYLEFLAEYPETPEAKDIRLPVRLESDPPGCRVTITSVQSNESVTVTTPAVSHFPPVENCTAVFTKDNYEGVKITFHNHKSFQDLKTALRRSVLWKKETDASVHVRPLIRNEKIFASSRTGEILCLSALSGKVEWRVKVGRFGDITPTPLLDGNQVFASSSSGEIRSISASGRPMPARFDAPGARGVPAVNDLYLVSASSSGEVYIFERLTGKKLVEGDLERSILTGVVGGDLVYLGCTDNHLYSLDVESSVRAGKIEFKDVLEADDDFVLHMILENDKLFAVTANCQVIRIDVESGEPAWKSDLPSGKPTCLFVSDDEVYCTVADGTLYVLDVETGVKKWNRKIAQYLSGCCAKGGFIYAVSDEGVLFALEDGEGKILWQYESGKEVLAPPVADDERVYITTTRGTWLALPAGK